jgi:hypothetical protein
MPNCVMGSEECLVLRGEGGGGQKAIGVGNCLAYPPWNDTGASCRGDGGLTSKTTNK